MSTIALDARVKVSGSFPWPIDFKTFIIAIMIVLFYGLIEEGLSFRLYSENRLRVVVDKLAGSTIRTPSFFEREARKILRRLLLTGSGFA